MHASPSESGSDDHWDFYMARVDDHAASVFLNMALIDRLDELNEDTLYAAQIRMLDPDAHGMGAPDEGRALYAIEDRIAEGAAALGLRYIGRLRYGGMWQVTFMGPAACEQPFERLLAALLSEPQRAFEAVSKADPDWSYYRAFLFPDAERRQWISDRRVVDALQSNGDPLTEKRRVDHWLYFEDAASRAAFAKAAAALGFACVDAQRDAGDASWGLRIHRVDAVALDDIHALTMELTELAARHGGDYDGWETSVEKP